MTATTQIQEMEALLAPLLEGDIFLVSIRVKPVNNIKIFLDADSGLSIDKCIKINRALYKVIEEKGLYPDGNFSLEVSSPGLGEPLILHRQYEKNVGRMVEVTLTEGLKKEGVLQSVTEAHIVIERSEGKGKKAVVLQEEIPFTAIRQTIIQVLF
jgi:ribosome maturation factor RimP